MACYAIYGKPFDGGWQGVGTGDIWYAPHQVAVATDASPGDTIEWGVQWFPVESGDPTPDTYAPAGPEPDSSFVFDYALGTYFAGIVAVFNPEEYGELRFTATVNGNPIPGYTWVVFAPGMGDYPNIASGYEGGGPEPVGPEFWTGFVNTMENV